MSGPDRPQSAPVMGTHAASSSQAQPIEQPGEAQANADLLPVDELPLAIPDPARRGVGKPKGSVNRRTNATFNAAVSRYGDPLIASIAWGNMDTGELIAELRKIASDRGLKLGATVMDIVRFQEECRRNVMNYGHAKRAAVDDSGAPVLPTFLGIGRLDARGGTVNFVGQSLEDLAEQPSKTIEHNQGDSDGNAE